VVTTTTIEEKVGKKPGKKGRKEKKGSAKLQDCAML